MAQVRFVTGSKILRILKAKSLAPAIPEDLYHLVKKAVSIRRHLERNRKVSAMLFAGLSPDSLSVWWFRQNSCDQNNREEKPLVITHKGINAFMYLPNLGYDIV